MDDTTLKNVTQGRILDVLEQMKKVDSDTRYFIFMEYFEMLFCSDYKEDILIPPTNWGTYDSKLNK